MARPRRVCARGGGKVRGAAWRWVGAWVVSQGPSLASPRSRDLTAERTKPVSHLPKGCSSMVLSRLCSPRRNPQCMRC